MSFPTYGTFKIAPPEHESLGDFVCLHRACDIPSSTAAVHPRASALYLLYAGDGLLLPQRGGRTPAPHEGGDW